LHKKKKRFGGVFVVTSLAVYGTHFHVSIRSLLLLFGLPSAGSSINVFLLPLDIACHAPLSTL